MDGHSVGDCKRCQGVGFTSSTGCPHCNRQSANTGGLITSNGGPAPLASTNHAGQPGKGGKGGVGAMGWGAQ